MVSFLVERSISGDFQRFEHQRQVSADLFAIALLLGLAQRRIRGFDLSLPTFDQARGDKQRSIRPALAFVVHIALPMRPTLMFDVGKRLHEAFDGVL